MNPKFTHTQYLVRKQIMSLAGANIDIFDSSGQPVLFSKMKAFKLKEDIRLFADDSMQDELISIQARSVIDFSATYDVVDSATGERLGSLRRKGMKSMLKDEWAIMDARETEIGLIKEDSALMALLRRFLTNLIPQKFHVEMGGERVALFKQDLNPFVGKLNLDFGLDTDNRLDRRLGLAAAVLLVVIERQQG
ncbi:hypothetical protein GZH47_08865 [Paenibacillus rhizovicinus]|uniref:LURP-one-related family protein n=1 Tax=Paenibacillus rhizovicinus TaxID=2704463 RepID=A0A6C0P2R3_9BACL|nr:hypothetical protein [Paenibacillus rhizovicinus]QHW30952.1 hypothetical protein GZH47_08865 [Paenibacillus rhizovicinus]